MLLDVIQVVYNAQLIFFNVPLFETFHFGAWEFRAFVAVFEIRFPVFTAGFPSAFHAVPSLEIASTQTTMTSICFLQVLYADAAVDTAWCYLFFRKTHLNPPLLNEAYCI